MFRLFLTLVWTLMHAYVFGRAFTLPAVARRASRQALAAAWFCLWSTLFLYRALPPGPLAVALEALALNWLGVLLLLSTCLFIADLFTGFGLFFRDRLPAIRGLALAAGCVLSLIAFAQGFRAPVVREYEVALPGLPARLDGTVLVAFSDTHLGDFLGEKWLASLVEQVNALKPDLVAALGDVVEGRATLKHSPRLTELFRGLSAPLGVWAVLGNHEGYSGIGLEFLENSGMRVLEDEWQEVAPGLVLAGVTDPGHDAAGDQEENIRRALANRPPDAASILLSHRPLGAGEAARQGAGLMLAGHTHGGQLWPFGWVSRLWKTHVGGPYQEDGMTLIVSRGAGTWGPRMRLWRPGEILRITLRSPGSHPL